MGRAPAAPGSCSVPVWSDGVSLVFGLVFHGCAPARRAAGCRREFTLSVTQSRGPGVEWRRGPTEGASSQKTHVRQQVTCNKKNHENQNVW